MVDLRTGLTPLFRTASGALYAQDADGRIYRSGELMFSGPLLACETPMTPDRKLAVGVSAFMLIDDGNQFGWRITTAIVELFSEPVAPEWLPSGKRWDSRELLPELRRYWRERRALGESGEPKPEEPEQA